MTERLISGASVWAPFIVYVYTALQLLLLWVRYRSQKKQGNLLDLIFSLRDPSRFRVFAIELLPVFPGKTVRNRSEERRVGKEC